jgi:glucose/arabinose dehydrogenase
VGQGPDPLPGYPRRRWIAAAALAVALVLPSSAEAAALQPIGSFNQPTYVTSDPANPNRLFVVERAGTIKVVEGGSTRTFADLTSVVQCCEVERGLFSLALPSDFEQSGLLYVDYTGKDGPGNLHVAELRASGGTASIATLRNVLTIGHSAAANHNGGQLQFGPDGYLYVSTGDGGFGQSANAQNTNSLLGKILRIDPRQSGPAAYSTPPDNPFVGVAGADEIWAYGFRNPWRFSFDRQTRDLLIADVGETSYEEVDYALASAGLGRGANYGWDCREGLHPAPLAISSADPACPGLTGYTDPIFEYTHAGGACAITGGYVVRDPSLGDLFGRYLYADLCLGQIRSLVPGLPSAAGDRSEGINVSLPVSFGEDSCGRLYLAERFANLYRLAGAVQLVCSVLRVALRGTGRGTVSGPGIACPPDCTEVFPLGGNAILKAHPGKRSWLAGWQGACSPRYLRHRRNCTVSMDRDQVVVARFARLLRTRVRLTAAKRTVPRNGRASLRAKVLPCKGRRHDRARLFRGRLRIAGRRLDRKCVARFRPRILHRSRFRVRVGADLRHRAGKSAPVVVSPGR